jgi:hypothetical protein
MFRNKLLGIAAAATLGSAAMLGSTAAYALKIFDTGPADRAALTAATTNDSFTYASETLLTDEVQEVAGDSTTYYNVGGTGVLVLSVPGDVTAGEDDTYLVSVALDGMVFRQALTGASLATAGATTGTAATFNLAAGGAAGENMAVFRKTTTGVVDATSVLNLSALLAVSAGGGSATVTLTNQSVADLNIPGVSGMKTHGPAKVIKVASALKETPKPNPLTASVSSSFKKFAGDMAVGHVGSLTVGTTGHRIANGAATAVVNGLEDIFQNKRTAAAPDSSVSFMGDFSFTEKVFVHGDDDCGAASKDDAADGDGIDTDLASDESDIRKMEGTGEDEVILGTTKAVSLDANGANDDSENARWMGYLCIMVQSDDTDDMDAPRIPNTDAYTAIASYKALAGAASGPMGVERMLGKITRDGTTVRLPYLTTNDKFSQRLRIVNRGSAAAMYEMQFHGDGDVDGDMATGMLAGNSVTILNLRDGMVVTPGNGSSTSGTLIIEAPTGNIDVATIQVNRELGTTDTVVYDTD